MSGARRIAGATRTMFLGAHSSLKFRAGICTDVRFVIVESSAALVGMGTPIQMRYGHTILFA